MTEKEIPNEHNDDDDDNTSSDSPDLSTDRQAAASMFASANRIIQNIQDNDSISFLKQSRQHGGQ